MSFTAAMTANTDSLNKVDGLFIQDCGRPGRAGFSDMRPGRR